MRKVYINVTSRLIIELEEGIAISDVMNELDWGFVSTIDNTDVIDVEMLNYEIIDSK